MRLLLDRALISIGIGVLLSIIAAGIFALAVEGVRLLGTEMFILATIIITVLVFAVFVIDAITEASSRQA